MSETRTRNNAYLPIFRQGKLEKAGYRKADAGE